MSKRAGVFLILALSGVMTGSPLYAQPGEPVGDPSGTQQTAPEGTDAGDVADPDAGDPDAADPDAADPDAADPDSTQPPSPHGTDHSGTSHQAIIDRFNGRVPPVANAEPTSDVPAGTIQVRVVDAHGRPASGTLVDLGVMRAGGGRSRREETTDAQGQATFENLSTGDGVSYRVNVLHEGAKFSSNPFRLPADQGFRVRVRRLDVTRNPNAVVQRHSEVRIEFVEGRIRVVQIAELVNPTEDAMVFPEAGREVPLPEGFTNFQSQEVMTDQKLTATDHGFIFTGSVPPGRIQLTWAFDLPINGTEITFAVPCPFKLIGMFGVIAEASPTMTLSADGLPASREVQLETTRALVTQIRREVQDDHIEEVRVTVGGIPGPGPYRLMALIGAVLFGVFGFIGFRGRTSNSSGFASRKNDLLEEAAYLEQEHRAGRIGPKFYEKERARIERDLAALLQAVVTEKR